MALLFDPFTLRGVTMANRIVVSPMCEYSCENGFANDWHLVHLGSRAVGGAGLLLTEATAVAADGRIAPEDLGLWSDAHVAPLERIVRFVHEQGAPIGVQLAHAGRKASTRRPWSGRGAVPENDGGWQVVGPTTEAFAPDYPTPRALSAADISSLVQSFADAAKRALAAGFDVVEVHAAHGYLLHQFLSPLSNTRTDIYGGSFDGRVRFCLEVVSAVRRVWPDHLPVFVRVSATDWTEGGWDVEDTIELARRMAALGVDLVDCSSGGNVATAAIPVGPGYQVAFAERIRREAGVATGAVGLITSAGQADAIVREGKADCVLLAREMLRDPYFPLHAAQTLGQAATWPPQYLRAAPAGSLARMPRPGNT